MTPLLILSTLLHLTLTFKNQEIKTSITNPLFLARTLTSQGIAVANEYVVEIYLRQQINSQFNIPYDRYQPNTDVLAKIPSSQSLTTEDRTQILGNLQQNELTYRASTAVYTYHLKKHIISEQPITGLHWGTKYLIIQTASSLQIYTDKITFLIEYHLKSQLLTMTSIDYNVYLLFQDPTNTSRLNQVTMSFDKNNKVSQSSFTIELPRSYKFYEYLMDDYQWLYMVNETHVSVYDIMNKKMKNTIASKFDHPITKFQVDQSGSLAIASNQHGDYLFISSNQVLLSVKNTNFTYATFCSDQYVAIGNRQGFQVMQVGQNHLLSQQEFENEGIAMIECEFGDDNVKVIYTIDESGYLGVYFQIKSKWMVYLLVIAAICLIAHICKGCQQRDRQRRDWLNGVPPLELQVRERLNGR